MQGQIAMFLDLFEQPFDEIEAQCDGNDDDHKIFHFIFDFSERKSARVALCLGIFRKKVEFEGGGVVCRTLCFSICNVLLE